MMDEMQTTEANTLMNSVAAGQWLFLIENNDNGVAPYLTLVKIDDPHIYDFYLPSLMSLEQHHLEFFGGISGFPYMYINVKL